MAQKIIGEARKDGRLPLDICASDEARSFHNLEQLDDTLLERAATSEYLSQNYPQMVKDVQKILTRSETEVLS